ncbi:putative transporter [Azorhizobium oxalatiphilum]|uniref:Transporter n=1 Tax=Azorhizobium oxalatiphilum TaxID=980631 RepID=A0A917C2G7_9HYPH|nr:aspartate-alanine antiporter [Azorhizobium oxalatiphilum]GGF66824.1 putative transporter [Azorhizobium oxalatiphilum]
MDYVTWALRENPELAIFLAVALGFLIGRIRFGSFSLGIVVGSLLAGVVIGQLDIRVPGVVKGVFFNLFLFTTGYKVGPQFFRGLKGDAMPQLVLTVVICVSCLLTSFIAAKLLGYDIGTAAGLLAGAFSESTVIGTAGDAIGRLDLPLEERTRLLNNIPVAYAVTYLIGTAALVWFIPTIGPRLMGADLLVEAARVRQSGAEKERVPDGLLSAARPFDVRAYRLTDARVFGRTIAEVEAMASPARVYVMRLRRGDEIMDAAPGVVLREGDVIALIGRHESHTARADAMGPEVSDPGLLDLPVATLDVIVTKTEVAGRTIEDLAGRDFARGVFLAKLRRAGLEIPVARQTRLDRGDVMTLIGAVPDVERAAQAIGYADRPTAATDMIFVGVGIFLGGLLGLLSVVVAGVPITLTVSGGALVMGLVFGWLRSVYPVFGRIPEAAVWIFDTLGLCMFISIVGIGAGPGFMAGLEKTGPSLILVGLTSALLPHTVGILFGRYVLRMNPLIVLGTCAGAGTITAALRAVQDKAQSSYPALGYTVPYAVGNILLTAWGPVLVAMMWVSR